MISKHSKIASNPGIDFSNSSPIGRRPEPGAATPFTHFPDGHDLAFQQACKIRGELLMRGSDCRQTSMLLLAAEVSE